MGEIRTRMSLRDFKKMPLDQKADLLALIESQLFARFHRGRKLEEVELEVRDHLGVAVSIVKEVTALKKFREKMEFKRI